MSLTLNDDPAESSYVVRSQLMANDSLSKRFCVATLELTIVGFVTTDLTT